MKPFATALRDDATVVLDACENGGVTPGKGIRHDRGLAGKISKLFSTVHVLADNEEGSP